jgi:hypothetical protein
MERTEALAFIAERLEDGCLRAEVVSELMEQNVSRASAYRWFNQLARKPAEPSHTDLVLDTLRDQLCQAQAVDDAEQILKIANAYASALAKFKRV